MGFVAFLLTNLYLTVRRRGVMSEEVEGKTKLKFRGLTLDFELGEPLKAFDLLWGKKKDVRKE
ncbi:MAG: hypothetical protein ABID54_14640 [Pseudomonadota bacterium]